MPPTHTDFGRLLFDVYEFSKEDSKSVILAADDPMDGSIGYLVYYERNGEEVARNISCSMGAVRKWISNHPDYDISSPEGRTSLANKGVLRILTEEMREQMAREQREILEKQEAQTLLQQLARSRFKNLILGLQLED